MHPFLDSIDWRTFPAPSAERPFGLMLANETDGLISDPVREKLIQIATNLVGPRARLSDEKMHGRWTASHNCKAWTFDTEGARAAFVMATKGDVTAL